MGNLNSHTLAPREARHFFRRFQKYKPWVLDISLQDSYRLTITQKFKSENSRELIIAFVYDREICQREEDDPQQAVLYFYPSWVTDEQRLILCGQLIGVTHFIESTFSPPSILSLQSGKFSIKICGRYIMCVGTDRNIPDSVLRARASILYQLLQFYHGNFEKLISNHSSTHQELYEKLSSIFEIYLPIMIFAGNIFSTIPVLTLPKSGSSIFLEASQILQYFQRKPGILGGIILYQNKVVVSQLSSELTKTLVISDPYRIKTPASTVKTPFHLPFRVQLLNVFLTSKQLQELVNQSQQMSSALNSVPLWQANDAATKQNQTQPTPILPTSMSMKRDMSRIFTVLEEEDDDGGGGGGDGGGGDGGGGGKNNIDFQMKTTQKYPSIQSAATSTNIDSKAVPDVVRDAMHARWISRLQSMTPASFVIPEINDRLFPNLTTDNIPNRIGGTFNLMPIRYYSLGLPQVKDEWCNREDSTSHNSCELIRPYYNSISDPVNPLFRSNGLPASKSLYHDRLTDHYRHFDALFIKKTNKCMVSASDMKQSINQGIPLTPLMAKLSVLANETQTPMTNAPSTSTPKSLISNKPSTSFSKNKNSKKNNRDKNIDNNVESKDNKEENLELKEAVLFVFGDNSTSLMLLMEPPSSQDPDQIHCLWESCTSLLSELESRLRNCMEHCPNTGMSAVDSYSFLCVEPEWGTTQRGGSWTAPQLELLTTLHSDLNTSPNITDFIVRCDESIVYAYQCGKKQVFYQQSTGGNNALSGLPTPSDLMGVVPLKARRRLERDHNIIIL
ncbi:Hermansky-Pudlak syndrome 4 protein isoform X2 [Lycorma delicatula]|uniref:Hermansky-Pudlak syndrome 4 protein isoform X2 n=1 Tax=Lycorma delicatula TaxID=130591 RepID=UPI003F518153